MKKAIVVLTLIAIVALFAYGCGDGETKGQETTDPSSDAEAYEPVIDPADFVASVDNPYLPLVPGTAFIYEGDTGEGREHIEVVVTRDTKEVMGIECVVVEDSVTIDGELVELTYDRFAQDSQGNVWYFGEDSKEYEHGEVVSSAGSWEAGVDGAQPGIVMQAQPSPGDEYRQEYYEGEAEDMAQVVSLDEAVSVPTGSYTDCLKTREWTPLEPGVTEFKYYAPGVGLILETAGASESRRIELIEIKSAKISGDNSRHFSDLQGHRQEVLSGSSTTFQHLPHRQGRGEPDHCPKACQVTSLLDREGY